MKYINELLKYTKFIIGGGLGLLVNLIATYLLTEIIGLHFRAAYAIGLAANVLFNFAYHRRITFERNDNPMARLYKFVPLTLVITATNYVLVMIFTELVILDWVVPISLFHQYYRYIAIVGVTGIVSIANYATNKRWVFR